MTTIVNNPAPVAAPAEENTGGSSYLIGAIILIGFVMVLLYFGIPVIQRMGPVQLNVPAPQVVVPGKIDVNVMQAK
jgi:hypothetical protein